MAEGVCVLGSLRDADTLFGGDRRLPELAQLGEAPHEVAAREHGGEPVLAKQLVGEVAVEERDHPLHVLDAVPVVAEAAVRASHAEVPHDLQRQIARALGKLEGTSTRLQSEVGYPDIPVVIAEGGEHPTEALGIVQRFRQALRFSQVREDLGVLAVRDQGVAQFKADVDRLLPRDRSVGHVGEGLQGLFQVADRFSPGKGGE